MLLAVPMGLGLNAHGQLRIVTYNTNTFDTEGLAPGLPTNFRTVRPEADIVFEAIGEELLNGIARPADIVLLQEQQQPDTTTQNLVDRLNTIYAGTGITYARGFEIGRTTGSSGFGTPSSNELRQSVVYRTDTVTLIDEDSFGGISGPTQPRETLLHRFRPIGYGPDADLYIFNSHFEAGDNTGFGDDRFARENEATDIREYIEDNVPAGANVIVGGDLNVDSNFETSGTSTFGGLSSLQILTAPGDARVLDPFNPTSAPLTYNNNFSLAAILTQSPANDGPGPLTGGGIDDRFDFLLQSDELLDGEGVASIPGSMRAFGNNGSTFNDEINDGNTIQLNGLTSFTTAQVLDALEAASDHLPVVEDFQLPAVLDVVAASVPATLNVGDDFDLALDISNAADVSVALGADELDYVFNTSGDLFGSGAGIDAALGGGITELVTLDTSTPGIKSGLITVTATSAAAANALVTIPVSFEVVAAALLGDFTGDGLVEQGDLNLVLNNWGETRTFGDGASVFSTSVVDQEELNAVLNNWGQAAAPNFADSSVPEPAWALGLLSAALLKRRQPTDRVRGLPG
ncbi:MAG: hypothetical protein AAF663_01310 [Planctomycetota bacterium]